MISDLILLINFSVIAGWDQSLINQGQHDHIFIVSLLNYNIFSASIQILLADIFLPDAGRLHDGELRVKVISHS